MARRLTIRSFFGLTTLTCGLLAAMQSSHGVVAFTLILVVAIALWPWLFGHG